MFAVNGFLLGLCVVWVSVVGKGTAVDERLPGAVQGNGILPPLPRSQGCSTTQHDMTRVCATLPTQPGRALLNQQNPPVFLGLKYQSHDWDLFLSSKGKTICMDQGSFF